MSIFETAQPFSYPILLYMFLLGAMMTTVMFGIGTISTVCILIYLDILQITPILDKLTDCIEYIDPGSLDRLQANIRKSLLIETPEQPLEKKPHIFLFHPHGVFSVASVFHIGTRFTDWTHKPIKGTMTSKLLWMPFAKELFKKMNCVPADYEVLKKVLEGEESLSVCMGGVREILYTEPNKMRLSILKKRGIFKLAIETGMPIVPVISYGENELFEPVRTPWVLHIQKFLIPYGICFPFATLESCKTWLGLNKAPMKTPIRTVIGKAIDVGKARLATEKEIETLRETYFSVLRDLYKKTKPESYADEIEIV
jgi:1-acyl-sn-glycerol-3-phosphate acyltransferase